MIVFNKLRYKNILSAGSEMIEINLNKAHTTLVVGQNGSGKSSMLDALSFGLFGKSHRSIKKDQLVNSINKKHALVEVEFTVNNSDFKIVRGIKPGKFEIWQNGQMINQASDNRDYQRMLETNILKLNHKSFHQIVVLGSSSFIPFMQLPAHSRREVIEDLLDINIFSKMNFLLKERNSKIKEDLNHVEYQLSLNVEKIKHQEKYINEVGELNRESKQLKLSQIKAIQAEIKCIEVNIEQLTDETKLLPVSIDAKLALGVQLKSAFASSTKTMSQIQQLVKDAKFYEANDSCPVCEQHIEEEFKQDKINQCKHDAKEVHAAMEKLKDVELTLTNTLEEVNKTIDELSNKRHEIKNSQTKITVMQSQIGQKHDELVNLAEKQTDVEAEQRELGELVNTKDGLVDRKIDCVEERTYNEVIGEMLKDTGIKTKIIKQYLPAMNKLINQYLQVLDFFVSFYLDEEFNETIRSRHRDDFQYTSFSEGEKQRIDLALLFTWRQIARMKNSTNTNLLILDETFDSSLDVDGLDNLTKILGTLNDDNNIFVISHKGDALESKFESKIEFYKDGNFSKIR